MTGYVKSSAPHIHAPVSVPRIYWTSAGALLFLTLLGFFIHGVSALKMVALCLLACTAAEGAAGLLFGKKPALQNGHSVYTAVLIALMLPLQLPAAVIVMACFLAIFIGKEIYGGLGSGFVNPAAMAVAVAFMIFPQTWQEPLSTAAFGQPLFPISWLIQLLNETLAPTTAAFMVRQGVTLGASSGLLVLLSVSFLMAGKTFRVLTAAVYLGTVTALCLLLQWDLTSSAFSAPVLLGGFILVNDNLTLPLTFQGKLLAAVLAAALSVLLWRKVDYFVAVSFSVLVVNVVTPWLDVWIKPKVPKVTKIALRSDL